MHAIWLQDKQLHYTEDLDPPSISANEALIEVNLAGICGTDLELLNGYYRFTGIPGHEFVGTVTQADSKPEMVGKRVVGEINISCGDCDECLASRPTHCSRREVLGIKNRNGAFAQYLSLPIENLHYVPDSVPNEHAVFVEPVAAACNILDQIDITSAHDVLIIGAGRLGQLIAQVLRSTGCNLEVCVHHLSQQTILNDLDINTITEKELINKRYDIVIESSGSPTGMNTAMLTTRPRGSIVLKSTYHGKAHFDLSELVVNEIKLIGSRCGSYPRALDLLEQKKIDPTVLIDKCYGLTDFEQAFSDAAKPGALKILFKINAS